MHTHWNGIQLCRKVRKLSLIWKNLQDTLLSEEKKKAQENAYGMGESNFKKSSNTRH